jgi:hypothetical protein
MHSHSFFDQIANAVLHAAVSRSVGALMRGHGAVVCIGIGIALLVGVWLYRRFSAGRLA